MLKGSLQRGDEFSCTRFKIALEKAVRTATITIHVLGQRGPKLYVAYVADGVLIQQNTINIKQAFIHLLEEAKKIGARSNDDKTKYIHLTCNRKRDCIRKNITVDVYNFKHKKIFKYVGDVLTNDKK